MQIVIPISDADVHPLTAVDGRPIVEHVTGMFPGETDFIFICSRAQLEEAGFFAGLRRAVPTSRIVAIEPHDLGPVFSTMQAASVIEGDTAVVVCRCDFAANWDFAGFRRMMAQQGFDGAVMAHRGFHPHERGRKRACWIRQANRKMIEIRSQHGFAPNEAPEYATCGAYYFRTGALLKHYLHRAMALGLSTQGEYNVAMPYNLMAQDGLSVYVEEVPHYAEWSTPEGLEQYRRWSEYFARWEDWSPASRVSPGTTLIPISGDAAVFPGSAYSELKALFPVAGAPMIERTLGTLPLSTQTMALCRTEDLKTTPLSRVVRAARAGTRTIALNQKMRRHACLCLIPDSALDSRSPALVAPSDASSVYDEYEFAAASARADCVVFTFRDHPRANRHPRQYNWIATGAGGEMEGMTLRSEPAGEIREAHGLTGMFWFREAGVMFDAIRHWLDTGRRNANDFSLELILENVMQAGHSVRALEVTHYIPFVTPEDVRTYEYWESFFRKSGRHTYGRQARIEPMFVGSRAGVFAAA
jgi:hypothetical protein